MKNLRFHLGLMICFVLYVVPDMANELTLIPWPETLEQGNGSFQIDEDTRIVHSPGLRDLAGLASELIADRTGVRLAVGENPTDSDIFLRLDASLGELGPEGYRLTIRPDGVELSSAGETGLLYGVQSLRQLASPDAELPALRIEDRPRFEWRGLMLDCSRTFQSVDYLRRTIDRMSLYKLNVLHLHLTDDQGWRIEIERYPELTRQGARFAPRHDEPASVQGFYSQREMRNLVRYAAARGITIVPEIEMPGHNVSTLFCYPELACRPGRFEIFPFFLGDNITKDILCAGNDETLEFLRNVLDEVAEIFPSRYIHIGGDEAPKDRWKECPKCQRRIREEGLQDEHELQGWLIRQMAQHLAGKDRQLIGWDEILECNLKGDAAVMSWRGIEGGITAAKAGMSAVMAPTSHCYFDYPNGPDQPKHVYSYEPVPEELTSAEGERILGLQACFWSHIDRTPEGVDAQLYPRLLAIAERGWSPAGRRDWPHFEARLEGHEWWLERLGVTVWEPPVGEWSEETTGTDYEVLRWDATPHLSVAGEYDVYIRQAWGRGTLEVDWVRLVHEDRVVAEDGHDGRIGWFWKAPNYRLQVPEVGAGSYELQLRVRRIPGYEDATRSVGSVYLRRLE